MKLPICFIIVLLVSSCIKNPKEQTIVQTDEPETVESTETTVFIERDIIFYDQDISYDDGPLKLEEMEGDTMRFTYQSDMCLNKGYYFKGRYTEEELLSTYQLWRRALSIFNYSFFVREPEDVAKIDMEELIEEYEDWIDFFNECEPVDTPFWKNLMDTERERIDKEYYLIDKRAYAYSNPSILLENKYQYTDCKEYAKIIASTDTVFLLQEWEKWTLEQQKRNGDPNYMNKFRSKYSSPNNVFYARADLITYAWWNCMNHHIERADYETLEKEFERLFFKVEKDCEEP